jgi:PPE-repeat protein
VSSGAALLDNTFGDRINKNDGKLSHNTAANIMRNHLTNTSPIKEKLESHKNSGDVNSNDVNSGDVNSGDVNSGVVNSGDVNSGDVYSGVLSCKQW